MFFKQNDYSFFLLMCVSLWPADRAPGLPLSSVLSHPRAPALGQSPGLREISEADSDCSFLGEGVSKDGCQATPGASIYSDDFSLFFLF